MLTCAGVMTELTSVAMRDILNSPSLSSYTLVFMVCSSPSQSLERPSTSVYRALVALSQLKSMKFCTTYLFRFLQLHFQSRLLLLRLSKLLRHLTYIFRGFDVGTERPLVLPQSLLGNLQLCSNSCDIGRFCRFRSQSIKAGLSVTA